MERRIRREEKKEAEMAIKRTVNPKTSYHLTRADYYMLSVYLFRPAHTSIYYHYIIMKFITPFFTLSIIAASAQEAHARRRRHLNDAIKGDESDASMSLASVLSPAGGSKSKSATGSPTGSPTIEVCPDTYLCV